MPLRIRPTFGRILAVVSGGFVCLLCIQAGVWMGENMDFSRLYVRDCDTRFSLLNPGRRCQDEVQYEREYEDVENRLEAWVAQKKREGLISHMSIYYRDLENGPWFGVAESEEFSAASLLKVPIMIAYLRQAERRPGLLTENIAYDEPFGGIQNVPDAQAVLPGLSYSGEEVLRRMIVYSDNFSKELLKLRMKQMSPQSDLLAETYHELGLFPESADVDQFLTVKAYASVFRVLYNGTYLSREMSQAALALLAQTTFDDGLIAGLPPDVTVAHKFGMRDGEADAEQQLHDCGIVYLPGNPYLLCIMTRGKDLRSNSWAIAEVTRIVHKEVLDRLARAE